MTEVAFASAADTQEQLARLVPFAENVYGYIGSFDPNAGAIVGPKGVLAIDTRATPALARELIRDLATVTDLPVRHIFLTHYHAVRVLGAAAYEGASVIASIDTHDVIETLGDLDMEVELGRFPRLFKGSDEIPGLTRPDITFDGEMKLRMGHEVVLRHAGRGHSGADGIVWLPKERILFSGDLVERKTTPYCGEAWFDEWIERLDELSALRPHTLMPGRGDALTTTDACLDTIQETRGFLTDLLAATRPNVERDYSLKQTYERVVDKLRPRYGEWAIFEHAMPFNVGRAYDFLRGAKQPIPWTAARDKTFWAQIHG
jgi:glyoxylase-like metal-dependent hydrolase (beta-lactamase superfamily II)